LLRWGIGLGGFSGVVVTVRFFVGLSEPSQCVHFDASMVSVSRLRRRRGGFKANDWIMDSGAFTAVARDGGYRLPVREYADQIGRFSVVGNLLAAVAQDWMCEPAVLSRTGFSVARHQALTIERYDELVGFNTSSSYVMPVLQGYAVSEYVAHLGAYGARLSRFAWVGLGSVCKRNAEPGAVAEVIRAVLSVRPDLRLHGFGVKSTALREDYVREALWSADSMAWSFAARKQGRDANDWREAKAFEAGVIGNSHQLGVA
jgi:hypothetical protein